MKHSTAICVVKLLIALSPVSVCCSQNSAESSLPVIERVPADSQVLIRIGSATGPMCSTQTWKMAKFTLTRRKLPVVIHTPSIYELSATLVTDRPLDAQSTALLSSCTAKAAGAVGRETIANQQYEAADLLRSLINKCVRGEGHSVQIVGIHIDRQQVCKDS